MTEDHERQPAFVPLPEWPDRTTTTEAGAETDAAPDVLAAEPPVAPPEPAPPAPDVSDTSADVAHQVAAGRQRLLYAAAALAFAVAGVMAYLVMREDKPGPKNLDAREACAEMERVSNEIIDGRTTSFDGRLDVALAHADAAARVDAEYRPLADAIESLKSDPAISTDVGREAVDTIAEECR